MVDLGLVEEGAALYEGKLGDCKRWHQKAYEKQGCTCHAPHERVVPTVSTINRVSSRLYHYLSLSRHTTPHTDTPRIARVECRDPRESLRDLSRLWNLSFFRF